MCRLLAVSVVLVLVLAGCGGGGSGAPQGSAPQPPELVTGYFYPAVKGLRFRSCVSQGYTGARGEFTYARLPNCTVTFCTGTSCLGAIEMTNAAGGPVSGPTVTPYDLSQEPHTRENLLRGLPALDADSDRTNGLEISPAVDHLLEQRAIDWASADLVAALSNILSDAASLDGTPHALADGDTARGFFFRSLRCLSSGLYRGTWFLETMVPTSSRGGSVATLISPHESQASGVLLESVQNATDPRNCPSNIGCRDFPFFDSISAINWTLDDALRVVPSLTDGNRTLSGELRFNSSIAGSDDGSSDQASFTVFPLFATSPEAVMRFAGFDNNRHAVDLQVLPDNQVRAVIFDLNSPWFDPIANTPVGDSLARLTGSLEGHAVHATGTVASSSSASTNYVLDGFIDLSAMVFEGSISTPGAPTPFARFDGSSPIYGCPI